MALHRYVVRVDPQGQSMAVDILDTSGSSVAAFDSPQFAAAALTLPLTIHGQTDFHLASPGDYDVSCKVAGAEVADAGAPKRVRVSDVPVLVVPDWQRELAADPPGDTGPSSPSDLPHAWYSSNPSARETVATDDFHQMAWVHVRGDALLDLTDPINPTVVQGGVYAVTTNTVARLADLPDPTDATLQAQLDLDGLGFDFTASVVGVIKKETGTQSGPQVSLSCVGYIPAGGVIWANMQHNIGDDGVFYLEANVQALALDPA